MEISRWAALLEGWTTASPGFYSNWDRCESLITDPNISAECEALNKQADRLAANQPFASGIITAFGTIKRDSTN